MPPCVGRQRITEPDEGQRISSLCGQREQQVPSELHSRQTQQIVLDTKRNARSHAQDQNRHTLIAGRKLRYPPAAPLKPASQGQTHSAACQPVACSKVHQKRHCAKCKCRQRAQPHTSGNPENTRGNAHQRKQCHARNNITGCAVPIAFRIICNQPDTDSIVNSSNN